jgi:hypothetical protein
MALASVQGRLTLALIPLDIDAVPDEGHVLAAKPSSSLPVRGYRVNLFPLIENGTNPRNYSAVGGIVPAPDVRDDVGPFNRRGTV